MVTIVQLTPNDATRALQSDGVASLGLTIPQLSPVWSDATPTFVPASLTLTLDQNDVVLMPFLGILESIATDSARDVFDVDGTPVAGPITRIRLHPQAASRLETLARNRYSTAGQPFVDSVATQMVVRASLSDANARSPQWWEPGDDIGVSGAFSLHDRRGLIVDPIAAAAMFEDLVSAFPALLVLSTTAFTPGAAVGDPGGLTTIAATATDAATLLHVVTPHGAAFQPVVADRSIRATGGAGDGVLSAGLLGLQSGQSVQATAADDTADAVNDDDDDTNDDLIGSRLLWGWSNGGRLARDTLAPPPLAATATLARRFIRLTVVDLPWHLLGNRGGQTALVAGVPPDDGTIVAFHQPRVRRDVTVEYLSDGVAVLANSQQVLDRINGAQGSVVLVVSPTVEAGLAIPGTDDAAGRWPIFPAVVGAAPTGVGTLLGATADWVGQTSDVVVTIPAVAAWNRAHVRVYPQQFVVIDSIGEAPSFLRGDGGAAIAVAGQDTAILLSNPLRLLDGQVRPGDARLTFDVVVTPRGGQRQLFGNNTVPIGNATVALPPNPFPASLPNVVDALLGNAANADADWLIAIAREPLFGIENPPISIGLPNSPSAADIIQFIRDLSNETTPRDGPRLPTQGRHESVIVTGVAAAGANGVLSWNAVVSGGRFAAETLSTLHRLGNPGHPAGPDIHTAGVRVAGDLALDAARHAARRVQPLVPLPTAGPPVGVTPGSIVLQGGNNFNEPSVGVGAASTGPDGAAGAFLKTVAAFTETPELALTTFDLPDDEVAFQDVVVGALLSAIGLPPDPDLFTVGNEDRLTNEVVREFYHARHGVRDALWSLRRSLGEARELVYIESPQLARTARADGAAAGHEIDLIQVLVERMQAHRNLRVVVCLPREGDFDPTFGNWIRHSLAARNEALDELRSVDADRVVAFHPTGFPGRHALIRSTTVIVDDCWALVGTSHFRRRGMTFDGAADVVSIPYVLQDGYAARLREFRRDLMLRKLGMDPTDPLVQAGPEAVRLFSPGSSFELFADLLGQDGAGMISPIWPGPPELAEPGSQANLADPDGAAGSSLLGVIGELLQSLSNT